MRAARRFRVANAAQPVAQPAAFEVAAGPERITSAVPLGDRIIIATSTGRVAAFELSVGRVLWQARVGDAPVQRILATDDFVVVLLADETAPTLVALDAFTGQHVWRRAFAREAQGAVVPVNFTLASDGTLVWLLLDRVVGKDLFEPGDAIKFDVMVTGRLPFEHAHKPEQLAIVDGRIVVLAENGLFVRVHSLETGKLLRAANTQARYATGATPGSWKAVFRVVGNRLYIFGAQAVNAVDLERPDAHWRSPGMPDLLFTRTAITREQVAVFAEPTPAARQRGKTSSQVLLFSRRQLPDGRETGQQEFEPVDFPGQVTQWQVVDGGIYCLTTDQQLHFLQAAR